MGAVGLVCDEDRGSLPYALIHGEPLVAAATWALEAAEIEIVDEGVAWSNVIAHGRPAVLHDPLCPMTPPDWIRHCLAEAVEHDEVVVGVRSVTDTVKTLEGAEDDALAATVDRDQLLVVCSPIVLPVSVVAALPEGPPTTDFVQLVTMLREEHPVRWADAPASAQRVGSAEDLDVLAAQTADTE